MPELTYEFTDEDISALVALWRDGEKFVSPPFLIGEILLEHFIECQRERARHSPVLLGWIAECLDKLPRAKDAKARQGVRRFIKSQRLQLHHSQKLLAWMADEFEKLLRGDSASIFKDSATDIFRLSGQLGRPLESRSITPFEVAIFVEMEKRKGLSPTEAVKNAACHFIRSKDVEDPERQVRRWLEENLIEIPSARKRDIQGKQ